MGPGSVVRGEWARFRLKAQLLLDLTRVVIVLLDPTCDRDARFLQAAVLRGPDLFLLQRSTILEQRLLILPDIFRICVRYACDMFAVGAELSDWQNISTSSGST